jgi:hypothetical protein
VVIAARGTATRIQHFFITLTGYTVTRNGATATAKWPGRQSAVRHEPDAAVRDWRRRRTESTSFPPAALVSDT